MRFILLLVMSVNFMFASIGRITAINGGAYAIRNNSKVNLSLGSGIEKKDVIKTLSNTKLQIVFNDHTVISLGQKTEFKIDDYVFSSSKVSARFSVARGIFKSITGKIGKIDHSKFKLKTRNATIGVRGTTFIGVVEADKELISCTSGEIVVSNDRGEMIVPKGEFTKVEPLSAPEKPKVINQKILQKVQSVSPEINSDNVKIKKNKREKEYLTKNKITEKPHFSRDKVVKEIKDDVTNTISNFIQHETAEQEETTDDYGDFASDDPSGDTGSGGDSSSGDDTSSIVPAYQAMMDKVGGQNNLHYEGVAQGENIQNDDFNNVNLDIDIGKASVNGRIKFHSGSVWNEQTWDTKVAGTLNDDQSFQFQGRSNHYTDSAGNGQMTGPQLENANGSFNLVKKEIIHTPMGDMENSKSVNGTFQATRDDVLK